MTAASPEFGLQAETYARYRPRYSAAVYDALLARLDGPREHAVDLGAGSGQVAQDLLARFGRVTAVEPDAAMAALLAPDPRLTVRNVTAEAADIAPGSVDAVVAGTAFHWMDAAVVCANAARWLRPGGVFFAFAYERFTELQPPAVVALLLEEAVKWEPFKDARLSSWTPYVEAVEATGVFARVEPVRVMHEWRMTPEAAAGFQMSTSFGSAYARSTGDPDAYARDLADRIAQAAGGAEIVARYPVEGALAAA